MRHEGVVLAFVGYENEAQFRALKYKSVSGLVRCDSDGFVYAWRLGSEYRDGTTPDRLQPGCRVAFEVDASDPGFVTGLSFNGARRSHSESEVVDAIGTYRGPDENGVEPVFEAVEVDV